MARGKGILEAIDKADALRVRSPLSNWMRANHDAFATRLSERIADWSVLAKLFADAGLTDRFGKPPAPETARKTWQRVRKEVSEARARRSLPPQARTPTPPPQPSVQPQATTGAASGTRAASDLLRVMEGMTTRSGKMPDPLE